ncbi:MAG: hypothetical protein U0Y10_09690 [Spirosomataceae bacterium]
MTDYQQVTIHNKHLTGTYPSTMSQYKLRTKTLIFSEMIKRQKELIHQVEHSLSTIEANAEVGEEAGFGGEAEARREASMELLEAGSPHYDHNWRDLQLLEKLASELEEGSEIAPGSVVLTDSLNFVIGVSMTPFEVEQKRYIGISTHAPIFASLVGKQIGQIIHLGNKTYVIEDIF